jgi:hypothetical protein
MINISRRDEGILLHGLLGFVDVRAALQSERYPGARSEFQRCVG